MAFFISTTGVYYQSDLANNPSDTEVSERPSINHDWNGSEWIFTFDADGLKKYRDEYIIQQVTHNGLSIMNTEVERNTIGCLLTGWETNTSLTSISFKHDNGISSVSYSDLQGLFKELFIRLQNGRSAEAVVLTNNSNTPYTNMQDAYDDFDTEVA